MFVAGEKAQTKLGNPVRFVAMDNNTGKMVVNVLPRFTASETVKYNLDGKKYTGTDTMYDLEMVKSYDCGQPRDSRGSFIKRYL